METERCYRCGDRAITPNKLNEIWCDVCYFGYLAFVKSRAGVKPLTGRPPIKEVVDTVKSDECIIKGPSIPKCYGDAFPYYGKAQVFRW